MGYWTREDLPFYHALLAFSAARAVVREAVGARGWEKTAHFGLHFSSQSAEPSAVSRAQRIEGPSSSGSPVLPEV